MGVSGAGVHHAHNAKTIHRRCRRLRRRSFETSSKPSALNESKLCCMRLPQPFVESIWFQLNSLDELRQAYPALSPAEAQLIQDLTHRGLPPATSIETLSALFGLNPGLLWAFKNRPNRYYRHFKIPKGKHTRDITAPKVGLKIIQSWLGHHLARQEVADHVFGFVPGRSHIDAAERHIGARWAYSFDISNFFDSTPRAEVNGALLQLGYSPASADLICALCTLNGHLVQGSPASPALSNICFRGVDQALRTIAEQSGLVVTRYADDVVFSGQGDFPAELENQIASIIAATPWEIHPDKIQRQPIKGRIKVHGLLVTDGHIALTKGYRNKIRAYRHIYATKNLRAEDRRRLAGHLNYARQVETRESAVSQFDWEGFEISPEEKVSSNWLSRLKSASPISTILRQFRRSE